MSAPRRAVVFAYHDVGVRGLSVLLNLDIDVPLVVTHEDQPEENVWFGSVQQLAAWHGIPCITPADPNTRQVKDRVSSSSPDWLFSFYYRRMLKPDLLALPPRGAYNLHGSLLPKYRGRVPVNWAVLHGERETGASLHRMVDKPDAGALVDQEPVAILPNDTAHEVLRKVTCAGEVLLLRSVPRMLAGEQRETPLDLAAGSYFGPRRPEDGKLDWRCSAWEVHNLIRAVAPPYPGAFCDIDGNRLQILGSYYRGELARASRPRIYWEQNRCFADCVDGERILLTRIAVDGRPLAQADFADLFGTVELTLLHR